MTRQQTIKFEFDRVVKNIRYHDVDHEDTVNIDHDVGYHAWCAVDNWRTT